MSSLTVSRDALRRGAGATKAFNLVLAEGLWAWLKERGVDVLAAARGDANLGYERAGTSRGVRFAPKPQHPRRSSAKP
jgi:hypothetical protein